MIAAEPVIKEGKRARVNIDTSLQNTSSDNDSWSATVKSGQTTKRVKRPAITYGNRRAAEINSTTNT